VISILITNYNKSFYLEKNIRLLKKSSYQNYEIIIFDDSSTDNSLKIIRGFKNIKIIINKKKKFMSSELNQINGLIQCFNKSRGDIICLLDADDYFLSKKLSIINEYFKSNKNSKSVYNFPKFTKKFIFKKKNRKVWPSIFPTSCISSTRENFHNFIQKYIKKNDFPYLEIDARFIFYSYFIQKEYNVITKKLTIYNNDPFGITSNKKKFSVKWWLRRGDAYNYLKMILPKDQKIFFTLDKFFSMIIYYLIKFFKSKSYYK